MEFSYQISKPPEMTPKRLIVMLLRPQYTTILLTHIIYQEDVKEMLLKEEKAYN